MTISKVKWR